MSENLLTAWAMIMTLVRYQAFHIIPGYIDDWHLAPREALAAALRNHAIEVFDYGFEKSNLWGKNLYTYLSDIYQNEARYCVMFLSQYYATKLWTNHEREAAQARAFNENVEYILPVRLDNTIIPGILPTIAYVSWPPETAESITGMIMAKLGRPIQKQSGRLDLLIQEWLLEKYRQTQSVKTRDSYRTTLNQYRIALLQQELDLDRVDCLDKLVTTARLFSAFAARGKEVTIATSNLRLSILSSFYEFAIRNDLVSVNPIDKIKRGKTQRYQGAHAIQPELVSARLRLIDTDTLDGKRDRALLLVYLQTCRRLSEVASLLWRDIRIDTQEVQRGHKQELVTRTFERCKGAKRIVDQLPSGISGVLLTWLRSYYGEELYLSPNDPLWVALAPGGRNGRNRGNQLGNQAIADICKKYLGTSKVHATRHTGTLLRLQAGATVQDIKKQLGHDSLATADYYIEVLLQGPDKHGAQVETMLL